MSHTYTTRSERSRSREALAPRLTPPHTSVTPSRQLVTTSLVSARTRAAAASVASPHARLLTQIGSGALAASRAAPTFGAQLPRKTLPVRGQNLPQIITAVSKHQRRESGSQEQPGPRVKCQPVMHSDGRREAEPSARRADDAQEIAAGNSFRRGRKRASFGVVRCARNHDFVMYS